jgi:hypothetical protein
MAKNTIKIKKYLDVINEYDAAAAITPGQLLELTSSETVQAHSSAGQNAPKYFALEDELQGNGIDDAYASGDKVQVWSCVPGEEVYAILADGENVAIGDLLESNGAGYLQAHVADTESFESAETGSITVYPLQIVGQALEALDLSDSSGGESSGALGYNKRIEIRIV